MQHLASLSDIAAAEIETLRDEGITPTPAEIVRLNAIGWAVQSPETRRLLARGAPVDIGGVYLWPMTLCAQDWFNRIGCKLSGNARRAYALGYAMAHGRDEGTALCIEGRQAEKVVVKWARALKCTFGELNVAISQVLAQDEEPEQPPSGTGGMPIGDFSAFLAAMFPGGDPEFWERRCAASYTYAVLDTMVRQNTADKKPSISDPRIKAERALGWAAEKIRRRWKEEHGEA